MVPGLVVVVPELACVVVVVVPVPEAPVPPAWVVVLDDCDVCCILVPDPPVPPLLVEDDLPEVPFVLDCGLPDGVEAA